MSIKPEGRKLLRVEARNAEVPIEKKPHWIKTKAVVGAEYNEGTGPGPGASYSV